VVVDQLAVAAGEDRRPVDKAFPLLPGRYRLCRLIAKAGWKPYTPKNQSGSSGFVVGELGAET
jgi:hypothetical protein